MVKVCFPFVGDSVGGSHQSAALLIKGLAGSSFEPVVVVHREGPLHDFLNDEGIPFDLLPVGHLAGERAGVGNTLRAAMSLSAPLRSFMQSAGIRLVHTNDARMNLSWLMPARAEKVPLVWHQRSLFPDHRTMRVAVKRAARVIAISEFVKASVPAGVDARVVPNPFETSEPESFRSQLRRELQLPDDAPVVGWFGRLVAFKKPALMLEMLSALPGIHVCFFGRDVESLEGELEQRAAALGVRDRSHLMGFRSSPRSWMAACDVVCAPTVDEGAGRVVVEAMLAGVPVIAADSGGAQRAHRPWSDRTAGEAG